VVYDLPGVGTNFQDTPTASLGFNFTKQVTLQGIWKALGTKGAVYEAAKQEYISNKSGPLILAQANSAAFLAPKHVSTMVAEIVANISSQDPLQHLPSIYDSTTRAGYLRQRQIILDRINRTDSAFFEIPINGRADPMLALLLKPLSRGTITLNHSDPELGPLVDYNALADPGDQLLIVSIVNFMRRLMKTPKLTRELGPTEVRHEPGADTYESILSGLMKERSLTPSCSHQSGACPMMPLELGGVVNDQLMVYGVERLSVVDSSIFPQLPAARLASTTFAVAEKAADLIKARHSRTGL
jgi:choline dehydrogenase-like flavoprotein